MEIKAISIWKNGELIFGTIFNLRIINDDLSASATFYYTISSAETEGMLGQVLVDGNITLNGTDYQTWDADPSANAWAINWALAKLNLELLPE